MEKTSHISIDKKSIKNKELKKAGQVLATAIINNNKKDGAKELKSYSPEDLKVVKDGFAETVLMNIRIPLYINSDNKLPLLKDAFAYISDKKKIYEVVFEQLEQLFEKFNEDIQNLSSALKEQYMPILQQKQQQLMEQTGQGIQLEPEQDPEFMELFKNNRHALEEQYNTVIHQAKDELRKLV